MKIGIVYRTYAEYAAILALKIQGNNEGVVPYGTPLVRIS
jgi:hypothetical protein